MIHVLFAIANVYTQISKQRFPPTELKQLTLFIFHQQWLKFKVSSDKVHVSTKPLFLLIKNGELFSSVNLFFFFFSFFFLCRAMNSINWVLLRQWYWDTGDKFTPGNSYWSLGTVGISVHKQVKKKKKKSRYLFSSCQVCNLAKKKKRWLVLLAVASKWYPVTMILNVSG